MLPINIVNKKEIYPSCCEHLFISKEFCPCCIKGCYCCRECNIDLLSANNKPKEKEEA